MRRVFESLNFAFLVLILVLGVGAPFFAPHDPARQFRDHPNLPPSLWSGAEENLFTEVEFWVRGAPYRVLGWTFERHLFGVPEGSETPLSLLGTDSLGRDLLSRVLFGLRFSIATGLTGIALTFLVGVPLGAISGYRAGWMDRIIMRTCDLFLSLPGLFLVLAVRSVLPLEMSGSGIFWVMVLAFVLIGWASLTRVVRGQVVSIREMDHVTAARALGASDWRILRVHILPFTTNYLLVQAVVFLPLFVLGEVTLSFLGVGVQEPAVSLGTLLHEAITLQALTLQPWKLAPAVLLFVLVFSVNTLGESAREAGRRRGYLW